MPIEITVPQLGESIVEATVGRWQKNEGDAVTTGESLVELETDKVNIEVTSPGDGVLASIRRHEGDTVNVGELLAQVAPASEQPASPVAPAASNGFAPNPNPSPARRGASSTPPLSASTGGGGRGEGGDEPSATPVARRIAAERHIDLQSINGTGTGGKITQDDIEGYLASPQPTVAQVSAALAPVPATPITPSVAPPVPQPVGEPLLFVEMRREERVRMSRRRQTIATRLVEAQHNAAVLTTFNEIDMSAVMEVRKRRRDAFKERYNVSLGYMSFFTRAVVGALKAFPRLNAEIQGNEMVLKHYYDIGIAVGVEEGLVVPVLRDADRLSFAEIERQIAVFAEKARKNQLTLEDIRGGTFTISNGGVYGSLLSTPILNGPQVGILGMHKIQERPVAVNGQVVIHPMMYVALSYDHRIVDGSEAVRFLVRIKELLEDPEAMLLEG